MAKTLRSRIAAVAVAAVGVGLLQAAPALAAQTTAQAANTVDVTSMTLARATATPVVGSAVAVNFGAVTAAESAAGAGKYLTSSFTAVLTSYPSGGFVQTSAFTGLGGAAYATTASTRFTGESSTVANGRVASGSSLTVKGDDNTAMFGNSVTASSTAGFGSFAFTPIKGGDYVLTVWNDADSDGEVDALETRQTISLTVTAAPTLSTALTTVYRNYGTAAAPTSTTNAYSVKAADKTDGTQAGNILVTLKNTSNAAYGDTSSTIYAYVTGSGKLALNAAETDLTNAAAVAYARSASLAVPSDGALIVHVAGDGTAGVGTINLYMLDAAGVRTDLPARTFTFYGAVTAIAGTQGIKVIRSGGYTSGSTAGGTDAYQTAAIFVKATDAGGNPVMGLTGFTCVSSDAAVISSCTVSEDVPSSSSLYNKGAGTYWVSLSTPVGSASGKTATVYVRIANPADTSLYLETAKFTFTLGSGTVATTTMTLDKTSYAPGEKATLTVTAKDSLGNTVADSWDDGSASYRACFGTDVAANKAVVGTLPKARAGSSPTYTAGCYLANGVETYTFFVPSVSGEFTLNSLSAYDGVTAITAKATVSADAATAAADAAKAEAAKATAAVAGLSATITGIQTAISTLVASTTSTLTLLSAQIAKIMKKLNIK